MTERWYYGLIHLDPNSEMKCRGSREIQHREKARSSTVPAIGCGSHSRHLKSAALLQPDGNLLPHLRMLQVFRIQANVKQHPGHGDVQNFNSESGRRHRGPQSNCRPAAQMP